MEFSIKAWTISSLLARSALVTSTFLMLVASSVTGNKLGVKTMAKLLEKFVKMIEFRVEHCDLTKKICTWNPFYFLPMPQPHQIRIASDKSVKRYVKVAIKDWPLKLPQFSNHPTIYNI